MTVQTLTEELKSARRKVVTDGYDMSLGEIASLYKNGELVIDPNYQRLFRWKESQKTRFIESLLLGIPVPSIFVFQRPNGVWELIDGLQRISTVLELTGDLRDPEGNLCEPLVLNGTNLLPGLGDMTWNRKNEDDPDAFDTFLQLEIKRSRMRVEILRKESDEDAKFEIFQRLNTGGSKLSEQEVRNSVLVMINKEFFKWLSFLSEVQPFRQTVQLTSTQEKQQQPVEIALRFIAYRLHPYVRGLDVHEYLDSAARHLAHLSESDRQTEQNMFEWTFTTLINDLGPEVFKRWDGAKNVGMFLISAFDAIAYGVAMNRPAIEQMTDASRSKWLSERVQTLWLEPYFKTNSGSGVRGTTRLTNLLPFGEKFFTP